MHLIIVHFSFNDLSIIKPEPFVGVRSRRPVKYVDCF